MILGSKLKLVGNTPNITAVNNSGEQTKAGGKYLQYNGGE